MTLEIKKELIDEKVKILRHFGILNRADKVTKSAVISVLAECKTEMEMEQCLYNVLHGSETLDQLFQRKGLTV